MHAATSASGGVAGADDAAAAAGVLPAARRLIKSDAGGPLTQAARDYDRASRAVRGRMPQPTLAARSCGQRRCRGQLPITNCSDVGDDDLLR